MQLPRRFLVAITLVLTQCPVPAVPLLQFNTPVTENFDTLASTTSAVLPAGWSLLEIGTSANLTYGAGTGSSGIGNTYSFGASSGGDRALGMLRSAAVAPMVGTIVSNQTGAVVTNLAIAYTGEQWRLGAAGRVDRFDFAYRLDAAGMDAGTWTEVDALDFIAPTTTGATGALNGNAPVNRVGISYELGGLAIAPGLGLMLRWTDLDATGADDGLAIDDFSITAVRMEPVATPESLPPGFFALGVGVFLMFARWVRRFSPVG